MISNDLKSLYQKLEDGEGFDAETGELSEEVRQALTLTQNNLQVKAIDYGYLLKNLDYELDVYEKEIKRLTAQKKALSNLKDKLKVNLSNAMQEFGIVELKGRTIKLNFRDSEVVEVYDIDALDDKFKTIKIEPDKVAIKQAIKSGEKVEGARLVEKQNLQIK